MSLEEIPLPLKGVAESLPLDKSDPVSSPHMNNCRPIDVLEKRIRIGQRGGWDKAYSQQIGGATKPIVELLSITVVN